VARLAGKQQTHASPRLACATLPHMACLWPAYFMRHGPFLARLVFSSEKVWSQNASNLKPLIEDG